MLCCLLQPSAPASSQVSADRFAANRFIDVRSISSPSTSSILWPAQIQRLIHLVQRRFFRPRLLRSRARLFAGVSRSCRIGRAALLRLLQLLLFFCHRSAISGHCPTVNSPAVWKHAAIGLPDRTVSTLTDDCDFKMLCRSSPLRTCAAEMACISSGMTISVSHSTHSFRCIWFDRILMCINFLQAGSRATAEGTATIQVACRCSRLALAPSLPPTHAEGNAVTTSDSAYQCGPSPWFRVAIAPTVASAIPIVPPVSACPSGP